MSNDKVIVIRQQIKDALRQAADAYTELINILEEKCEEAPNQDPMDILVRLVREEGVHDWAQLYQDPQNELKSIWLAVMPPSKLNAMQTAIAAMSREQESAWVNRIYTEGHEVIAPVVEGNAEYLLNIWPEVGNTPLDIKWLELRYGFVMAALINTLAAMHTGKTMYQLVAEAMAGDDDSFVKAIQMDKTVLEHIPYFVERNRRAADEGDIAFLRRINEHRNKPLTITQIAYVRLWLVFDQLDKMNLLGLFEQDMKAFAELCQSIRVYGPHPDVDSVDVEDFASRLKDYKRVRRDFMPKAESIFEVKDVSSPNSPP